jgi:small subunit ribosomal protein S6
MRDYEALVIMKSTGTEQEVARQAAALEEPIKKVGGTLKNSLGLGRRKFAFRILRQTEGYYYVLRFGAPTAQLAELDRLLRLNESIVRFMILTADEVGPQAGLTNRSVERPGRPMGAGGRG